MSKQDRENYLARPHAAALSIAAGPDRAPLTIPIWYHYEPGGEIWFHTTSGSRKAKLLEAAGRATFMVDEMGEKVQYVSVEGPVVRTETVTEKHVRTMAERYLPAEAVDGFVAYSLANFGDQTAFYIRPEHWLSAVIEI